MSGQGQWQVAGNAAEIYERALVPAVFAAWTPLVVALADPKPGERVLDIACGTGLVARLAAERVGRTGHVVGLDLNPGMLAVAASVASNAPAASAPITWQEASATKMPLPDAAFDIAYCQLGLQFFPDRPAALRETYRVLVHGGRLGLMVWRGIEHSPGFRALAAALERHVSAEAAGIMRAPFGLAEAKELHTFIAGAGFREITIQPVAGTVRFPSPARLVQDYAAGSPLAGHVVKVSDDARAALISEVGDALRSYMVGGVLAFPIEAHLASAKK
ncbi:methyltransferase domain-containing protein [Candidatus Poribacteria bacterium]|nr:methyltransferase domain-containing protein [Candidatus Poribacteria bacterium]